MNKLAFVLTLAAVTFTGCKSMKNDGSRNIYIENNKTIGGDRDAHGCLTSAGYTWSVAKNDCVRIWEVGVKMISATNPDDTQAAFVVFSADSAHVEVFITSKPATMLNRYKKMQIWGDASTPDEIAVVKSSDGWIITSMNNTLYKQAK